jgi:DNA-binding MarR family transcriptional regulator
VGRTTAARRVVKWEQLANSGNRHDFARSRPDGDVRCDVMRKGHGQVNQARSDYGHAEPAGGNGCLKELVDRLHQETPLWQDFLLAHRQLVGRLAEQMMTDHQLPLDWFDVLIHLADMPGMRLRQRDLRDRLLLSESGVSRLLVRMARAGLIARAPADDDRRGVEVELTDRGRMALSAAIESHLQLVASLFTDRLTAADRVALNRVLSKLLAGPELAHRESA